MSDHEFTTEYVKEGECGSHYCGGHGHTELVCSCGFRTTIEKSYGESRRLAELEHKVEALSAPPPKDPREGET